MSDKKMSDVFNEMIVKTGRNIDTADLHFISGGASATFFCVQQAHHAAHAINNHDRLAEENKQLRQALVQHHRFCKEVVAGYEGVKFYEATKQLLNK